MFPGTNPDPQSPELQGEMSREIADAHERQAEIDEGADTLRRVADGLEAADAGSTQAKIEQNFGDAPPPTSRRG